MYLPCPWSSVLSCSVPSSLSISASGHFLRQEPVSRRKEQVPTSTCCLSEFGCSERSCTFPSFSVSDGSPTPPLQHQYHHHYHHHHIQTCPPAPRSLQRLSGSAREPHGPWATIHLPPLSCLLCPCISRPTSIPANSSSQSPSPITPGLKLYRRKVDNLQISSGTS